jgi:hypothetical protein
VAPEGSARLALLELNVLESESTSTKPMGNHALSDGVAVPLRAAAQLDIVEGHDSSAFATRVTCPRSVVA